ncbi:MAG: hypothetical protein K2H43_02540, partial [Clostridia bacterium]|nr:hypothetical protein [Clostridia bacterium]
SVTAHAAVSAACTENGAEAYWECTVCGKLYADEDYTQEISSPVVISASGHTINAHAAVPATCAEDGTEAYWECTVCGKLYADEDYTEEIPAPVSIEAAGHGNVTKIEAAQAAETITALSGKELAILGLEHYLCGDCGKKYVDEALTLEITVTTAHSTRMGSKLDLQENLLYAKSTTHNALFQAPADGIYVFSFADVTVSRLTYMVTDTSPVSLYSNEEWVSSAAYADKFALNSGAIGSIFYADMKQGEIVFLTYKTKASTIFETDIVAIEEAEHMLIIGSNEISVSEVDAEGGIAYQFTSIADGRYRISVPETSAAYIWVVKDGVPKTVISALEGTVSYMFKATKGEVVTFYVSVDTLGGDATFPASYTVTVENNVNFPEIAIGETPTLVDLNSGYSAFAAIVDAETAGTYIFQFDRNGAPNSLLRNYYYLYVNGVKQEAMIQANTDFILEIELKAGENLIRIENAMPQNSAAKGAPVVVLPKE